MKARRLTIVVGLSFMTLGLLPNGPARADDAALAPRTLTDVERASVEVAALYLDEGVEALWPLLADDAPIRVVGRDAALEELKVRLGAARGARWTLRTPGPRHDLDTTAVWSVEFATGIEDALILRFEQADDETFRLRQVLSTVDPRERQLLFDEASAPPPVGPNRPTLAPPAPSVVLALIALIALIVHATSARPSTRRVRVATDLGFAGLGFAGLGFAGLSLGVALFAAACATGPDAVPEEVPRDLSTPDADVPFVELRELLPLRRALTDPRSTESITETMRQLPRDGVLGEIARTWKAQRLQQAGRLAEAETVLATLPEPSILPLASMLRARQALLRSQLGALGALYGDAVAHMPDTDSLRLEATAARLMTGDLGGAEIAVELLTTMGSRDPQTWYLASRLAAIAKEREEAARLFRIGWTLEPITREALFREPVLAWAGTQPENFDLFDFGSVDEPAPAPSRPPNEPLDLPAASRTLTRGDLLLVELGDDAWIEVPRGALHAPAGAVPESALDARTRDEDQALVRLDELAEAAATPGALAHPARRRVAETGAEALVDAKRWDDVLRLTDGLVEHGDDDLPALPDLPDLLKARAVALYQSGRDAEAKNLMVQIARSDLTNRRRDPGTFYDLAEMFVQTGDYDLALELLEKADKISPWPVPPQRLRQIRMDQELQASFSTHETENFLLRYPRATGEVYPQQLGWVLEAEWRRLQRWIPVPRGRDKVEIHLFPVKDFMQAYSAGVTVLGLYDGQVRVPLADLRSLHPQLVAIVSHEVAHAMIDLATDGHAPKWLHEGLASHVEMAQNEINPIPDLHEVGRDLSFTVIEPILRGFAEPEMVDLAYRHAAWTLHYVESRWGERGIHDLLRAFRRGADTPTAIRQALRVDVATLDRDMHRWAIDDAPAVWPTEVVRYDRNFDPYVRRDEHDAPRFARSRRDVPRLGTRERAETPSDTSAEDTLRAWHAEYRRATTPVKERLGRALPLLRGQAADPRSGDLQSACRELADSLAPVLESPALQPRDRRLRAALVNAYSSFHRAAQHCLRGETAQVRSALEQAQAKLGEAHRHLEPYGLAP